LFLVILRSSEDLNDMHPFWLFDKESLTCNKMTNIFKQNNIGPYPVNALLIFNSKCGIWSTMIAGHSRMQSMYHLDVLNENFIFNFYMCQQFLSTSYVTSWYHNMLFSLSTLKLCSLLLQVSTPCRSSSSSFHLQRFPSCIWHFKQRIVLNGLALKDIIISFFSSCVIVNKVKV